MGQDNRIEFAVAQLQGRLHAAMGDKRCGCGPCRFWVARAARSAGISRQTLEAHLAPVAKPQRPRASRQVLTSRLGATCTRCNGTGGHSDFGNWVNCSACRGTGQK